MYIFRQRNQLVRLLVRIMIVIRDWQRWSMIEIVLTRCQWMDLAPSVSDNCMLCCSQSLSLSIFLFCNLYFCISAFCVLLLWFCALKVLKNRTMEPSLISIYSMNAFELLIFSLYHITHWIAMFSVHSISQYWKQKNTNMQYCVWLCYTSDISPVHKELNTALLYVWSGRVWMKMALGMVCCFEWVVDNKSDLAKVQKLRPHNCPTANATLSAWLHILLWWPPFCRMKKGFPKI